MAIKIPEVLAMVFSILALVFTVVAMAVQNWVWFILRGQNNRRPFKIIAGPYRRCDHPMFDEASHCRWSRDAWGKSSRYRSVTEATAAFLTIGFILLLVCTILIFLFVFVNKLKTKIIKIVIIIAGLISAICLLVAFIIWVASWNTTYWCEVFGPGTWLDLVAAILAFVMTSASVSITPSSTLTVR